MLLVWVSSALQQRESSVSVEDLDRCDGALKGLLPWPREVTLGACSWQPVAAIVTDSSSSVLQRAVERYRDLVVGTQTASFLQGALRTEGLTLHVSAAAEEQLGPGMNESYAISVGSGRADIKAPTVVGALRGLETFSQLTSSRGVPAELKIKDEPRFSHRGVLLDSSRHFLPVKDVQQFVDALAWNKLNVLHWHLTDSQGFALDTPVAEKYGLNKGELYPGAGYSLADLGSVVSYAADRGVRVVPEIDGPSHVQSWAKGMAGDMVIDCGYDSVLQPVGDPRVYQMLDDLVGELAQVFPDKLFHLGTDEVRFNCLDKSGKVKEWMKHEHKDEKAVVAAYIGKTTEIAKKYGKEPVVWQEAFDAYGSPGSPPVELPKDALVQVWEGWPGTTRVPDVVEKGFKALKSYDWYLDNGSDTEWEKAYVVDPQDDLNHGSLLEADSSQAANLVMGGEACLWGEHIDTTNLNTRAWPRLSAVAERLWSPAEVRATDALEPRLENLGCRMKARGVLGTLIGTC